MKILITSILLVCLSITSMAQTRYRFLTPVQVPGLIAMEPVVSLPANPGMFSLVNQGGKVWISTTVGWEQLWPLTITEGGGTGSDTLLYQGDIVSNDSVTSVQTMERVSEAGRTYSFMLRASRYAATDYAYIMGVSTHFTNYININIQDHTRLFLERNTITHTINDVVTQVEKSDTVRTNVAAKFAGDIFWTKYSGLSGNYNVIWNAMTHKYDTAAFIEPAAQAWRDRLGLWPLRYLASRDSQALPLPNRAGVNLRRIDPGEGTYQVEYELEMVNRGLWQLWCVVAMMFVVLGSGLVYVIFRKQ